MAPDGSSPATAQACSCGRTIEPDHLFCPGCGRSRSDVVVGGDAGTADGSLLLMGREDGPAANETTVRTGPGLVPRVVGIGLALVGVVLMWALFRQPSGEVAPEPDQDEEAVADTEPDGDSESDDGATDETNAEDDDEDGDGEAEQAREEATTTTQGPTSSDPSGGDGRPAATDEPVPPLLGEETGLQLVVGRESGGSLEIIDLDSGVSTDIEGVRGTPIGQVDSSLVLLNPSTGSTLRLDLDDPTAEAVTLGGSSQRFFEVVEISDGAIWVATEDEGETVLQAIDLTGEVIDQVDFPLLNPFGFGPWSLSRPSELFYDPAGGLYRRSGDDFELVAEGQVLAAGERVAVMRQCDDERDCALRWYDIRSSGVIGFPAPPPADGQGLYQLVGGDRWLVYIDWRTNEGELIEVATSRSVRDLDISNIFGFEPTVVTVSDDGRWLVDTVDGMLVVVDLDNGNEWPTGRRSASARTLFVER